MDSKPNCGDTWDGAPKPARALISGNAEHRLQLISLVEVPCNPGVGAACEEPDARVDIRPCSKRESGYRDLAEHPSDCLPNLPRWLEKQRV